MHLFSLLTNDRQLSQLLQKNQRHPENSLCAGNQSAGSHLRNLRHRDESDRQA